MLHLGSASSKATRLPYSPLPLYYPQLDKQIATLCAKLQEANALSYIRRLIIEGHFLEDHSTSLPPQVRRFSPLDRDPRDSY
jgi:hypothetical protein